MKALIRVLVATILFTSLGLLVGIARAEAPTQKQRKILTQREQIDQVIALEASKLGVDGHKMSKVIQCESGYNISILGDNGRAFGLGQFHKPTFDAYSKPGEDYHDWNDQIVVMARMWKAGEQRQWTCYRTLYNS